MKARNPILLLSLLLSVGLSAGAATYYVSSISGNDSYTAAQAQSSATPWKTIAKLNSFMGSLNPGDQVLLQAGSVFSSQLNITKSGIAGNPITFSTYGSGAMPMISGFRGLPTWTNTGGNIWQATCSGCGLGINMVEIGDSSQPMGRWPNAGSNADGGYNQIQSYTATTAITDSHLAGTNWTGASLVIRKNHWIIENDPILLQSGNIIKYQTTTTFPPSVKFGYFIQNAIGTLDKPGEWYYNPNTSLMYVYSIGNPAPMNMYASTIDTLIKFNNVQYVLVNGVAIQGANKTGVSFLSGSTNSLTNCSIRFSGIDGIDIASSTYLNINNDLIDYTNNDGISMVGNYNTIQNCTIRRTAVFPGMGTAQDGYEGIYMNGNYNKLQYNTIDTTGYSAIAFEGGNVTVADNLVNTFCFVKDDGGGIYTWSGNLDSTVNKNTGWITSNIVLNGITAQAGTDSIQAGIAIGVYLDENTTECEVQNNTVSHCTSGVFFQDSRNCMIQNNLLFDNAGGVVVRHLLPTGTLKDNDVSGNTVVSYADTEYLTVTSSLGPVSELPAYAYMHNNKYAQLLPSSTFYLVVFSGLNGTGSFGSWQGTYQKDIVLSTLAPMNFAPYTVNSLIGGDLYTKGTISAPFSSAATGTRVITSAGVGAIDSGYYYVLNFTMNAPDNAHTMLAFMEANAVPYPKLTSVVSLPTVTPSSNNTVVWQATATSPSALLTFQIQNNVQTLSLSNITLYRANVTKNDPTNNYIFQYNASKSAISVPLSGTYTDAGGVLYTGSVSIPAYGSILLIKKT
jgi:parallel beta-helix repeat protein